MSYVRTYRHYENVHGSKTVSYPASESGGTMVVSYSDTAEVTINIEVDTLPFDNSVSRTCQNADLLTGAVVGMQGAQIQAIRESANRVSDSMINGFYALVRKDISGQQSEVLTELKSKFALLMSISKDLNDKMERMESDVSRLRRHYSALFNDMNVSLEKRIGDVNGPAFQVARTAREEVILNQNNKEAAFGINQIQEDTQMKNGITSARIYKKISDVLSNISSYISRCVEYKDTMDRVMEPELIEAPKREYVPTIVCEMQNMENYNAMDRQCFVPEMQNQDYVKSTVNQYLQSDAAVWRSFDQRELEQIHQAFSMYVEDASRQDSREEEVRSRVYRQMMNLWQNNWNNIKSL